MKAQASTVAAACIITMLGACHLVLGVEEKPFVPLEGSGGNAASSSGQGMGGNASQSSNSSSTASGMGGMMTTSTTSSSTNAGSGGTGGQGGSATTTAGGGGSKDTCDTCTGKDIGNVNVCAQQGNIETGIGWSYFDPSCLQDPNSSIHCLGQPQQGCRRCRLCSPGTKDNINKAGGCFVCLDPSGTNCASQAGKPTGTNQGEEYCPPCICQKFQSAIHNYITTNVDSTVQFAEVLDMCQGNYDHCSP